jgi:hypothetical protein
MAKFKKQILTEEIENKTLEQLCETMTGREIAKELGVTPQYVSNTLKSGLRKFYNAVKSEDSSLSPFKIAIILMEMLNVEDTDVKQFFRMLPPDIRKEVEADATKYLKGKAKDEI